MLEYTKEKFALYQEQLRGSETGGKSEREEEGEYAVEEVGQLTEEQDVRGTVTELQRVPH